MDIKKYMAQSNEKPLDNIAVNGGFCGIFRKITCVGDSLSSGEFESQKNGEKGYHDYYDYSWGQYIARDAGCTVYNFSAGGMTAREYCKNFANSRDLWNPEKRSQAYIMALGVNDVTQILGGQYQLGTADDIDLDDYKNNKDTFAGWYAHIIQRYKQNQPKAKFFLMTMPRETEQDENRAKLYDEHCNLIYKIAEKLENCYVLDFRKYASIYNGEFRGNFYLGGHMNAAGYRLTALMVESYIDYIIRHNPNDFRQIGFVGTPFYNETHKW